MGTKQICSILIAPYRIFFFFLNLQSLSTWALGFWQAWWLMFPFQYKKKPSAINRLLVIKPWQVKATGCHCRLWYERERADVSGAAALNVSDEYQLHIVPFICETQHVISRCFYANTLHESRSWRRLAKKKNTHLISLSHVAVEDPPHALYGRMLQLMCSTHVVVNASENEKAKEMKEWILFKDVWVSKKSFQKAIWVRSR